MTIAQAISKVDELKPNAYGQRDKVRWLAVLDGIVKAEILQGYDLETATESGTAESGSAQYDDSTPDSTVLLVPFPYDEIYIYWLMAQIDFYNGEMTAYNNDILMYNSVLSGYQSYVVKQSKQKQRDMIYFGRKGGVFTGETSGTTISNPLA